MKEDNKRKPAPWASRKTPVIYCLLVLLFASVAYKGNAQCSLNKETFTEGEQIHFDLYFKWGILMPKAGSATLTTTTATYEGKQTWRPRLIYRTSGMIDKMFKVRDTIDCYFTKTEHPYLLYSSKRTFEGGYYQIDNLTFTYENGTTNAHSFRRSTHTVKVDTNFASTQCVFDVLAAIMQIRSIDWTNMDWEEEFPLQVVMGRDQINVSYKYMGQQIVERGDVKYRTRYFIVDIYDDAFTQSKEAAEIWVGDDDNHIPIKIRAKLKIGAAEAYYHSSSNLRKPLDCRFEMPRR